MDLLNNSAAVYRYQRRVAKALSHVGVSTVTESALLVDGKSIQVADISVGDVVAVRAGDQIPVDGVVTRGSGSVDESAITGESIPLHKEVGSAVLGGTVCQQVPSSPYVCFVTLLERDLRASSVLPPLQGYLEVRAEGCGSETMLHKIQTLLERAQGEKTRSQTLIESFVKFYTPAVLLCALIFGLVCGQTDEEDSECIQAALVVLILACPCALVAAAPSPIAFGISTAVRGGAVIKSAQAFEDLASFVSGPLPFCGSLAKFQTVLLSP